MDHASHQASNLGGFPDFDFPMSGDRTCSWMNFNCKKAIDVWWAKNHGSKLFLPEKSPYKKRALGAEGATPGSSILHLIPFMEMSELRRDIAPYVAHFANKSLGMN